MTPAGLVLVAQAVASGAMCGIIWFVQAVHYPLFARRAADDRAYALENQRRTGRVVIPFMLVEGLSAALLAWSPPPGVPRAAAAVGLAMVAALWVSTAAVQMPLHARLASDGHEADVVTRLVRSNWLRTLLWSLRAGLAAWMVRAAA
ncbi:MAG: hypothetical protein EBZ59_03845 [Planctomycetia bacterium]|nr:hypothetical protein [Planctomycetia bacterium]